MSVNSNVILGEIDQTTDCFLIGRHSSGGNVIYTVFVTDPSNFQGMLSVGASLPVSFGSTGGYTLVRPTITSAGIFSFTTKTFADALTSSPTVLNTGFLSSAISGTDNKMYWSASSSNLEKFKITPQGNNVPKNKLYAGIWYKLSLASNNSEVKEGLFDPAVVSAGWSGEPASYAAATTATSMDITFIPRTSVASLYTSSLCTTIADPWELFVRFDAWVRYAYMGGANTYEQANCNGPLGTASTNCLFMGTGCNNLIGYSYCNPFQTCTDGCFGVCSNGQNCKYDPILAKFVCPSPPVVCESSSSSSSSCADHTTTKKRRHHRRHKSSSTCSDMKWHQKTWVYNLLLIIFFLLAFFVLYMVFFS